MTTKFTVEADDSEVLAALQQLLGRMQDLTPAMREISETMMSGAEEAFVSETDPSTGQKWAPLSEVTVLLRGGSAHPILQRSGQLLSSHQPDFGPDFAVVGTNKVYAKTQHFGARKGQFRAGSQGISPIPWGDIPARPALGFSQQTNESILDTLAKFLAPP